MLISLEIPTVCKAELGKIYYLVTISANFQLLNLLQLQIALTALFLQLHDSAWLSRR